MTDTIVIKGKGQGGQDLVMTSDKVVDGLLQLLAQGNLAEATDVYMRCQQDMGYPLMSKAQPNPTQYQQVANLLYQARDFAKAAVCCEEMGEFDKAAALYEQWGDTDMAAQMYARTGNKFKAAQMFERKGDHREAAELYLQADADGDAARCFDQCEMDLVAARLFRKVGKADRALQLLQKIPGGSPDVVEATAEMVQILKERGQLDLVINKVMEVNRLHDPIPSEAGSWVVMARGLLECGQPHKARRLLDQVAAIAPDNRDVAELRPYVDQAAAAAPPEETDHRHDEPGEVVQIITIMEGFDQLKRMDIFSTISLAQLKRIHDTSEGRLIAPGEVFIEQNAPGKTLFVITAGEVEVRHREGAEVHHLASLGVGDHVGEMSLIDDAPNSAEVVAKTEVKALAIDEGRFSRLLAADPDMAQRIYRVFLRHLAERLRKTSAMVGQ
jgi:tetratricopeptide (TPR) repeat protein